jgi:hypothetical protein
MRCRTATDCCFFRSRIACSLAAVLCCGALPCQLARHVAHENSTSRFYLNGWPARIPRLTEGWLSDYFRAAARWSARQAGTRCRGLVRSRARPASKRPRGTVGSAAAAPTSAGSRGIAVTHARLPDISSLIGVLLSLPRSYPASVTERLGPEQGSAVPDFAVDPIASGGCGEPPDSEGTARKSGARRQRRRNQE